MVKYFYISIILASLTGCHSTKNGNRYSKFCLELISPGIVEVGEDSVHYTRHNFLSHDKYNIYEMYVHDVPTSVDDSSNVDTVFFNVDPFTRGVEKKITGHLVYNYENRNVPGLVIPKDSNSYLINVDSFFSKNTVKIEFNEAAVNKAKLVSESITDSNVIIRKYAEPNIVGATDSLILFYSKDANTINYSITDKFLIKGLKLYKMIIMDKPTFNVDGTIAPDYNKIVLGLKKLDLSDKEVKFIQDCIEKYKKAVKE